MPIFKSIFHHLSQMGQFWQKPINRKLLVYSILLIIIQVVFITFYYDQLPRQVPLFYSRPWGKDQLVSSPYLYLLPITSFVILLLNMFLIVFFAKISFLSISLLTSSTLYSFLSLFTLIKIIYLLV